MLPLRFVVGLVFVAHGSQKLYGWFGGNGLLATATAFEEKMGLAPGLLWAALAGGGEFFGGLLVLFGLLTRFGALNIVVVMLVAIFHVHWGKFFAPAGIEYPLALLGGASTLLIAGGGSCSIDRLIHRRLRRGGEPIKNSKETPSAADSDDKGSPGHSNSSG
jgi:putative oxidoreductase